MPIQLIIAAVIAATAFAGGFGTAWKIQAGNINAKEAAHAKQELANVQQSAAADIRRLDNAITAQNRATARAVALRRDADLARTELGRLRLAVASAVQTASTSPATCPERAAALGDVLTELGRAGAELAEKADRHASDVKTLTEAWPK
jgi:NAD-dependent DNA ligase